ncbi:MULTISPECIES: MarR family winged helix-turn-helix transcriptional regulator [unclassified Xanthobacter]|uniref:MarR family winged helix-turn-helix transcriptional regulator n=1 Tax=unclassified Xanthobacter TaxID=2623496 RepID=UPI001EDC9C92|nr:MULTISPECIES: MarR family transcriptional regulator [unclassified Xanthobacter]
MSALVSSSAAADDLARVVAQTCLCLAIQRASRAVGRCFDEAFRPLGLTNWQFSLLAMLSRPEPFTVTRLAEAMGMDRTTITSNLKPLERKRLVTVATDAQDRRVRRIVLSARGQEVLEQAARHWQQANAAVEARLGEVDPITLRMALDELAGA